jgi:hypothetical protein
MTMTTSELVAEREALETCQWFFLCRSEATAAVRHPILGLVPVCDRCVDKLDLPVSSVL